MKKTIITLLCSVVLFTSCALSKEGKAIPEKNLRIILIKNQRHMNLI